MVVDEYIRNNFSFCVLEVNDKSERLKMKSELISTVSLCSECKPSQTWFGFNSPKSKIQKRYGKN